MASPPFNMEDQTDEDFFDKLVSDEFEITESGQAKSLSNLTLGDSEGDDPQSSSAITESLIAPEKDISVADDSGSLVSSTSFIFDTVIESNDPDKKPDSALDSNLAVSRLKSVKEVQWSAFNTDSAQHDLGGFGSYSDFFTELGDSSIDPKLDSETKTSFVETPVPESTASFEETAVAEFTASFGSSQHQDAQDLYSSQYWESMYPGWRYDQSTGEWVQLEGYDATTSSNQASSNQVGFQDEAQSSGEYVVADHKSEVVSYLQQTAQSVVGTVTESCSTGSVSNWNGIPEGNVEYPSHMVFDPNYPGWYYDMIAQEWRLLETYTQDVQTMSAPQNQQTKVENASFDGLISGNNGSLYNGQFENFNSQGQGVQGREVASFNNNQQIGNLYGLTGHVETVPPYGQANQGYVSTNGAAGFQFNYDRGVASENIYQFNEPNVENNQPTHFSDGYYNHQKPVNYSQSAFQTGDASRTQFSYAPSEGRSSAGRPPHALVTFGFGGKLVVMKDVNSFSTNSVYESQEPIGGLVSILNLVEVVMSKTEAAIIGSSVGDYFRALCQQSFPGPLVGGNVASKELNKWIDERIANCEFPNADLRKGELLRLLFSLLKISCQHYGKLRSPFGVDSTLQEVDGPESAVTKLFASARRNGAQLNEYGALTDCMQNLPSEGQIRATAIEVQNLLVSGRRIEALQCAQDGQLWGPAVVLASQLGEKFYVDAVKQMAQRQFVAGSPLRTLCLLIAGQPADVFSSDSSITNGPFGTVNISQQPTQIRSSSMLDDWEENLAIITANRTKDDELVIIHLGDCLWKERGEVTAAHTCYLVAEANFESYSDTARMCLIGADHWKCPRTYASPLAIQRTELYEYSKVLGNSQFILLPFQPYKLIYAYMLAEVGKVSESLRYCQAILKLLKSSGRAPEVETWKVLLSSLEDRIRMHQQGGYNTNLAPAKLVGKLFTSIDRSIHRMIGAPPPPVQSLSQSNFQTSEHVNQFVVPKVASSQSTMAMSSLMPSASMEPISGWTTDSDRMTVHNRSISEPDFGRSPIQEGASAETQGKSSIVGSPSRFGRIGSQLFQKTMGWVSRSRPDRQAKLGDKNKFYYDEKLKRWVEEGAEPPAEEAALPPPPTTTSFQNGMSDYNINSGFKNQSLPAIEGSETKSPNPSELTSGIPPIPSSMNQFSARGRVGVRSRYVDTFNKGGGTPTNLFQSPSIPAPKPGGGTKFFVPTPANSYNQTVDPSIENIPEASTSESTSAMKDPSIPRPPSSSIPRFSSMDNLPPMGSKGPGSFRNGNGSLSSRSVSWSGSGSDTFNPTMAEIRSPDSNSFMPGDPASMRLPMNGGSFGDDLHEVEL